MWNLRAKKEQQLRPYRDAIARKIAGRLVWLQQRIVQFLQRADQRLPLIWKKAIFIAFIVASSAWCSYTFFIAVLPASKSPPNSAKSISVKKNQFKNQ